MDTGTQRSARRSYDMSQVIKKGSDVCSRIKLIFFANASWNPQTSKKIAILFTELKVKSKPYFQDLLTDVEFLDKLYKWPEDDYECILQELLTRLLTETVDK